MGCASSSPFIKSTDGVLTAAKGAATDAVHVGEEAINDVKDGFNERVGHVKDAVIGAVQNVGHGIENAFSGSVKKDMKDIDTMDKEITEKITNGIETEMKSSDYKIIPLKDPTEKMIDDALDEISETYDENIHDVKDMIRDTTDTIKDTATNLSDDVDKILSDSSPIHSTDMDSLKTTSPEPEIEQALANNDPNVINPPTPKPTYSELEKLQNNISDEISSSSDKINKSINKRINDIIDDDVVGGIYEHQKITDSQIALIREGVAAAAVPGVTGVPSKKEKIIKRSRIPDIKKNLKKSNILNANISTRWEKRHDKLAQFKKTNNVQRRPSSETLWSGSSGEFTKPRTMYLVFGNNFLKTPKIKVIDGTNKASRWTKREKLDSYELDLYTGIQVPTTDDVNKKENNVNKKEPEALSRWAAKPLIQQRSFTPELFPSQQRSLTHLRPLSPHRSTSHQLIPPSKRAVSQRPTVQLPPLSPRNFLGLQSRQQQKTLRISKQFENNEKLRIDDDDDSNSDKIRKEKAAEWIRNNVIGKSFDNIPSTNTFADIVDKSMQVSNIFTSHKIIKEVEQKANSLEINNVIDDDRNRKISIDGFLDDFREIKKGNSITKFRKADEVERKPNKSNNRDSFRKIENRKMDYGTKNRVRRNRFIRESKSYFN